VTNIKLAKPRDRHPGSSENSAGDQPGAHRSIWDLFAAALCLGFIAFVLISVLVPVMSHADETLQPKPLQLRQQGN
jgi:hypothetical protein